MKQFRVIRHSDIEGFPNCWMIQEKYPWQDRYKFRVGYFKTEEEANEFFTTKEFKEIKGLVFNWPPENKEPDINPEAYDRNDSIIPEEHFEYHKETGRLPLMFCGKSLYLTPHYLEWKLNKVK